MDKRTNYDPQNTNRHKNQRSSNTNANRNMLISLLYIMWLPLPTRRAVQDVPLWRIYIWYLLNFFWGVGWSCRLNTDVYSEYHVWQSVTQLVRSGPLLYITLQERAISLYILYKRLNVFEPIQFSIRMHQQPNEFGPVVLFHPHFLMILWNLFSY